MTIIEEVMEGIQKDVLIGGNKVADGAILRMASGSPIKINEIVDSKKLLDKYFVMEIPIIEAKHDKEVHIMDIREAPMEPIIEN